MKTQTTSQTVEVRADGEGLVSQAGALLLVELADRIGLTALRLPRSWPWAEALTAAFARLRALPVASSP